MDSTIHRGRLIKVFYCYAHQDKKLRDELANHLAALRRVGQISEWHDRQIQPGAKWQREIDTRLETADIILLLISADFIASDYCWGIEMKRALERHDTGEARVIPIILRPVDWQNTPIGKLQALPTGGKPVTQWSDHDEALWDVAKAIREVVTNLHKPLGPKNDADTIIEQMYNPRYIAPGTSGSMGPAELQHNLHYITPRRSPSPSEYGPISKNRNISQKRKSVNSSIILLVSVLVGLTATFFFSITQSILIAISSLVLLCFVFWLWSRVKNE